MRANFERLKATKTEDEIAKYCKQAALLLTHSMALKDFWRMRLKVEQNGRNVKEAAPRELNFAARKSWLPANVVGELASL